MTEDLNIRRAAREDLPDMYDVFYQNEVGDHPSPPPRGDVSRFFRQELETGEMYVAERAGMRARWPNVWLKRETDRLRELPSEMVDVIEAHPQDPDLVDWDTRVSGRYRLVDHRYWAEDEAIPLWFERRGARVGYAYIQMRRGSLWSPNAVTIGTVGALTPDNALACLCASVSCARSRSEVLRLSVPGPHPGLAALLDAGFRIVDVETFMSTAEQPFLDPECYIGSADVC